MKTITLGRIVDVESVVYVVLCLGLWLVPVFDRLHVESAAVISFVAFFLAGLRAITSSGSTFSESLVRQLSWLALPWGLMTLSAVWAPNCDYLRGLGFFVLFVPISVVFSVSLASLLKDRVARPALWLALIGVGIAVLGPVFDIGLHPQFYTYNHVFGGILGPIYDVELVVRPGLFVFRGLTLLWSLLFLCLLKRRTVWALVLVLSIGSAYVWSGPLGINTPSRFLKGSFSGVATTEHFDVFFDDESLSESSLARLLDEHEFRYVELTRKLGVEPSSKVISYVYPDVEARARMRGARYTSVAPVWLADPQVHVTMDSFYGVFAHELAHVFSREFGLPVIRASTSIGLVEGLAVALEPPDGRPTPHELVAAFERSTKGDSVWTVGQRVTASLSALGFWGGRGAVSYTTTGSFVHYLLEEYGADAFREAYRAGSFSDTYQKSVGELAQEWQDMLLHLTVEHPDAGSRAARQFSVLSLFETTCPHYTPPDVRAALRAARLTEEGRHEEARDQLSQLIKDDPAFEMLALLRAEISLEEDHLPDAARYLSSRPDSIRNMREWLLSGHYAAIIGNDEEASASFAEVQKLLSTSAHRSRAAVAARQMLLGLAGAIELLARPGPLSDRIESLETYRLSAAFSPDESRAFSYVLGSAYFESDRFDAALPLFESVLIDRKDAQDHTELDYATFLAMQSAYGLRDLPRADAFASAVAVLYADDPAMSELINNWKERITWLDR